MNKNAGHKKDKANAHVTGRAFRMYGAYNPKYFPIRLLQCIFDSLAPYFNLWISAEIVTALYEGREKNGIYLLVTAALIGNLLIRVMGAFMERTAKTQYRILTDEEAAAFNRKVLSLDYDKLENPEIRKHRRRIIENSYINFYGVTQMRLSVEGLMKYIVNVFLCLLLFAEMVSLIVRAGFYGIGAALFAAMLLCMILNVVFQSYGKKKNAADNKRIGECMLEENRMGRGHCLFAMDSRVYCQQKLLDRLEEKGSKKHLQLFTEMNRKRFIYEMPAFFMQGLLELCSYLIVFFYCGLGIFPVGGIIKYVGYLGKITENIGGLFNEISHMKVNAPFLKVYIDFFDIKNDMYQGSLAVEKRSDKQFDIEFKNVSFRYAGAKEYALKNIDLQLKAGERLAVVGMNGSGKTTFIKLLCRLYDPTEGEIVMNDFNVRKYDYRQYLDIFSVVFQDYNLLAVPLGNNVACAEHWDSEKTERLLKEVGFGERYAQLEKGLDTPLFKNFDEDGVNVSGGEAQKIALARALYRDTPFIILDEPTAALDPIAEAEIYSKFDEIVGDKSAIYISHRLSSCRFCDKIAVFDKGRIVQVGTHDELLSDTDGKYYELWNAQAQYYRKSS